MVVFPSVFFLASVDEFLCAHGADFGQNLDKRPQNTVILASFSEKVYIPP